MFFRYIFCILTYRVLLWLLYACLQYTYQHNVTVKMMYSFCISLGLHVPLKPHMFVTTLCLKKSIPPNH